MSMLQRSATAPMLSDGTTSLRRFRVEDAKALAAIHRDPENVRWTASDAAMDCERAADLIVGSIAAGWGSGEYLRFAITENRVGANEVIGTLSLHEVLTTSSGGSASVGIKMLPAGRGTGSALRAVELLCGYAFGNLGLEVLHWRTTAGNASSTALAERSGFILAAEIPGYGCLDGQVADGVVLSQNKTQYQNHVKGAPQPPALDVTAAVPVLRSETVVLRALTMNDAPQLVENCLDLEAVRWTTVPLNYTLDHADFFINNFTPQGWQSGETLTFAVADPRTDRLLGTVDLQCKSPGSAAIGINFGSYARGTGASLAALRLLLDYAFNQLNLSYVHWNVLVPNWGSRKLAWKLGFSFDGHIRGDYNDRGTPADRWVLSLSASDPQSPQQPWTGPGPLNR